MSFINSWPVFARQIALVVTPLFLSYAVSKLNLPQSVADLISAPVVDLLELAIVPLGVGIIGWVIRIGQKREPAP